MTNSLISNIAFIVSIIVSHVFLFLPFILYRLLDISNKIVYKTVIFFLIIFVSISFLTNINADIAILINNYLYYKIDYDGFWGHSNIQVIKIFSIFIISLLVQFVLIYFYTNKIYFKIYVVTILICIFLDIISNLVLIIVSFEDYNLKHIDINKLL